MATAQAARPEPNGTRTLTVTPTESEAASTSTSPPPSRADTPNSVGVLRLRGGPVRRQRVVWSSETVDNEGMGKKKSKICCIYHKPRAFDESSSESDSCSDDDGACSGHKEHATTRRQRPRPVGDAEVESSESSESDGGAGDSRPR
ncbi:Type 1 phosphatases regulator YPI1 [Vanrija pseudolonga]|uniref:Type 1 phosphatases regulator n=1 Tax=Vanrija pseudolonga TaxID=143232 RepID=A0AAF0YCS5_9TREE|nr:Type 1 phosphatases regulator YPI1 [Vanrija pseudolonga]